ncbi:MAG: 4-alpha-glucanotransferase, partial [Gemmatimonadetes bacterium]|nr:4-alpha-glucanotransferase [Gemmatimonadota bacterium]
PPGRHRLDAATARRESACTVISAPSRVPAPVGRGWGIVLPLHAYGNRTLGGVAGYDGLAHACSWVGSLGGAFVSTLPLLAAFLDEPFEPSPYVPASRLFWSDLFIDATSAPGGAAPEPPIMPDSGDLVDYRTVAALRRRVLERAAQRFYESGGAADASFREWRDRNPHAAHYARFRAACERWRSPWRQWPSRARDGCLSDADVDVATFRYHEYAAWVADAQLGRIADGARNGKSAGLHLDLPIGVHADGYDVWRERPLFAPGVSVGAPPDPFFRDGQNWGFPPVIPAASRADAHRHFGECLRHHLKHAAVLRIDHAMSLQRLFWIPAGAHATDGVYVGYPQDELLAVLCLEAARAGAVIAGEDLGTVTPEIRAGLDAHRIQRMYVAQFEFRPASRPPLAPVREAVVASVNTHDLPPFAAFWAGLDLDDQHDLGLLDDCALRDAHDERAVFRADICRGFGLDTADPLAAREAVLDRILSFLAGGPAALVVVNPEDLWGETRPHNVPGTTTQRPNWRRRAVFDLEALLRDAQVETRLREIAQLRAGEAAA